MEVVEVDLDPRASEKKRKRDEREDWRLLHLCEEVNDEQDEAVRAERPSVGVVDLSSFGPDFDCGGTAAVPEERERNALRKTRKRERPFRAPKRATKLTEQDERAQPRINHGVG